MKQARNLFIMSIAIMTVLIVSGAVSTAGAQSNNVTGTWKLTVETQAGTGNPTVTLKQEGEELTGTYKGRLGEAPLKGTVKGNEIKFSFKVSGQGGEMLIEYAGTIEADTMKGKVKLGEFGEGTFSGKKE